MKKTIIIYTSYHHNNTKKLLDEISKKKNIKLIKAENVNSINLDDYDYIGFASGIYTFDFSKQIINLVKNIELKEKQKVFLIYTYGFKLKQYDKNIISILKDKRIEVIGSFGCKGYDTFGILKYIGGISRNHPNNKDFTNAKNFINNIIK